MKLTPEAAQALTNLRANGDFEVFMKWLKEYEKDETAKAIKAEGTICYRAQGGVIVLQEIADAAISAPTVLGKLKQQQR